jgi:hypothetical protein
MALTLSTVAVEPVGGVVVVAVPHQQGDDGGRGDPVFGGVLVEEAAAGPQAEVAPVENAFELAVVEVGFVLVVDCEALAGEALPGGLAGLAQIAVVEGAQGAGVAGDAPQGVVGVGFGRAVDGAAEGLAQDVVAGMDAGDGAALADFVAQLARARLASRIVLIRPEYV